MNAVVLLVALSIATSEVVITVAMPRVQVPLQLQVSGGSVDSGPAQQVATGPVTTTVSFQWRTAVGEVRHPERIVVPAGTRLSLCLLTGVAAETSGNTTCVSPRVRFRTTKAAVLDGEPCSYALIITLVYYSCGNHASVPAVPDGGTGLLPSKPNTELYAEYLRPVTVRNAAGDRAGATVHATASLPVHATTPADLARTQAQMRATAMKALASYGHAHVVRFEPSGFGDFVVQGGRTRYVPRTKVVFYTDEQLQDAVRYAFQTYVNSHAGLGLADLDRIVVRTAAVAADTSKIAMTVEVSTTLLNEYRVVELAQGCTPSVCQLRLTSAGMRLVSTHYSWPWLRRTDLTAHVRVVIVQGAKRSLTPALPRVR